MSTHQKKARNHYIARLLLNRFASRAKWNRKKKKCWIWQVEKNSSPRELSTRDTALSKYFYGKSGTGVEDAFQRHESNFAQILAAIDRGDRPDNYHQELSHILWLFYTRTRAMRDNFGDCFDRILDLVPGLVNTDRFKDTVIERVKEKFRAPEEIKQIEKQLSPDKRSVFSNFMSTQTGQEIAGQLTETKLRSTNLSPLIEIFAEKIKAENFLPKVAKDAHIKALANMMEEQKAPPWFKPARWELIEFEEQAVILGDSCMFAVSRNGIPCSILRAAKDWQSIYFPISSSQVLIAHQYEKTFLLTLEEINKASAEIAYSYIYASHLDRILEFSGQIGNKATFFTEEEAIRLSRKKQKELIR